MHEDSLCQLQDGVDYMQHAMQCFLVRLSVTFSGKMYINTFTGKDQQLMNEL